MLPLATDLGVVVRAPDAGQALRLPPETRLQCNLNAPCVPGTIATVLNDARNAPVLSVCLCGWLIRIPFDGRNLVQFKRRLTSKVPAKSPNFLYPKALFHPSEV